MPVLFGLLDLPKNKDVLSDEKTNDHLRLTFPSKQILFFQFLNLFYNL